MENHDLEWLLEHDPDGAKQRLLDAYRRSFSVARRYLRQLAALGFVPPNPIDVVVEAITKAGRALTMEECEEACVASGCDITPVPLESIKKMAANRYNQRRIVRGGPGNEWIGLREWADKPEWWRSTE